MDARTYWNHYVEQKSGVAGTASHLGLPYSTIAGICNGSRGIGRRLAQRMAAADPILDKDMLVWVTAQKKRGPQGTTSEAA